MMMRDLLYTIKKRFDQEQIALAPPRTYITFDNQTQKYIKDFIKDVIEEVKK
jgi:hypothetical protein